ncbi:WXG100 family type VII secretion target [Kitasatospora sp. NPDC004240]
MSDHILVNFETVRGAGSEVRSTAQRIDQQLSELKSGVQKIASTWEGAAQQGYQAHQQKWDQRATDLQQVLQQIASTLDKAAESYQSTERNNAGLWQ